MTNDPRIRGVCPYPPQQPRRKVRPAKDRCAREFLGTGFRIGSIVRLRTTGEERQVKYINYYHERPKCNALPGQRILMTLDLGGQHTTVPWDAVDLVQL